MEAPEPTVPSGTSTAADNADLGNSSTENQSAKQSTNCQDTDANPTHSLLNSIVSGENNRAQLAKQQQGQKPFRRALSHKTSIVTRTALAAEVKAEIRIRFKLTDATFEQLPLVKTLAAVQILTKLANRTVKYAKQDTTCYESTAVAGKLIFSPYVVQAHAPQKTQLPPQLVEANAYEPVPELVQLSGVKQGGNVLLAICHFYNAAVTRAGLKHTLANLKAKQVSGDVTSEELPSAIQAEMSMLKKLIRKLHAYINNQFPKLITLFDESNGPRGNSRIADMVNSDFFLFTLSKIAKHDIVKENDSSGRINLNMLFEVVHQAKQDISVKGKGGKETTLRPAHLRNASLNVVVTAFIHAYVKMERNFFRESRVRARFLILDRLCCLVLLVKFKVPGCRVVFGEPKPSAINSENGADDENVTPGSPGTSSAHSASSSLTDENDDWFRSIPKTKTADRVKLEGFKDIDGAELGFPIPLKRFNDPVDEPSEVTKALRDHNRMIFKQYQSDHPEFILSFRFKKYVVSAPNTNDVFRTNDFRKVPSVGYTSKVDLLAVARDYLTELLGCTSWPQLFALHDNALFTIISFARTLLAITKDYLEGPLEGSANPETPEMKDKAHMQMFYVTTCSKLVRPVQIGNVAGVFGLKQELPIIPASETRSNTAFVGELHKYFDSNAQKRIAAKICLGKKEYDNGVVVSTASDCDDVEEKQSGMSTEEPATKRARFSFYDDSDAEDSE